MNKLPTERSFGLSVGLVCLGAGALSWWRGRPAMATALSVTGAVLLAAGLVAPRALAAPNRVWWRFAQVLGWINTRVLLTAFFFAVITPVGVVMRLCGRNPLQARPGSGWLASSPRRRPPSHYDHLF